MTTIKKSVHRVIPFLLALMLVLGMTTTAFAAETASLDFTKTGSVTLSLEDSDGNAVSDGAVTIYEAAVLYLDDGNMAYRYTEAFSGCNVTLDVSDDVALASALAAYVASEKITGDTVNISADGSVSFSNLELGLYLIVQTTDSTNYETINPFIVTVPMDQNGVWIYAVDASPKVGTVTPAETEPETTTAAETTAEETTEETTEEETTAEETTEEETTEEETTEEETTEEEMTEEETTEEETSEEETTEEETTEEENAEEETTEEETTKTSDPTTPGSSSGSSSLPQTGQLNWPIPILTVGGLLLFMVGWYLNRTGRKQKEHAN